MNWSASKANRVLAALLRIGWSVKRKVFGSHSVLQRSGWPDYVFAFHEREEIGPGLKPAEAPRAWRFQVSVWSAREGRARLSERTLGERSDDPAGTARQVSRRHPVTSNVRT